MDVLILKTNINSEGDFIPIQDFLHYYYDINECSIDLEDRDKSCKSNKHPKHFLLVHLFPKMEIGENRCKEWGETIDKAGFCCG